MATAAVLALAGIRVLYDGREALRAPELTITRGELVAVIGPNGSGKSTLLRVLGLLQRPTEGEVRFQGRPVDARRALAERRRMAMVFQQPLLADTTVRANVALGLRFRGTPPETRAAAVGRWLERLAIAPLAGRRARTLSGGEAQRVALARALVLAPDVLLLDEPFAGLDQPSRGTLIADLGAVLRSERVTTVLVTHDRAEALALADRVAVLMQGTIHQIDTTARVFQAPVSEEVARFVGVETIVEGEVLTTEAGVTVVDVAGRKLEIAADARPAERVRVAIRPEDVTLAQPAAAPALSSARNHLAGAVVRITPGNPARVLVDCGFPLVAAVTARSVEELGLAPGVAVTAIFKASAAHLIRDAASLDTPTRPAL